MAAASYDQLLKQVEALKMENSNLRQELEDNSNHLTKLETEASNMKEVLKQLQGSIEDEAMASSGQIDLLERLKELNLDSSNFPGVKLRSKMSLRSYGSREGSVSSRSGECSPVPMGSFPRRGFVNGSRESTGYLEELEKERSLLLADLDKEEKEKDWYYAQLQNLTKRIDSLPLTENFSLQTDMTRRQLEYEARQIRVAMEEQLGTCQDMEKRAQRRVARIQQIEKDILRIRQLLQSQATETERSSQSKHEAGSHEAERQNEGQGVAEISMATSGSGQGSAARMDHETASVLSSSSTHSAPRRLTSHLGTKIRAYCETCWEWQEAHEQGMDQDKNPMPAPVEHQICPAVCVLMKLSFDEEHRHAMNELGRKATRGISSQELGQGLSGGLQAIAELLQVDCEMYGLTNDHYSITLRRYAGMALTNLTFGDVANKATLCSMKGCMRALVAQLKSESEDLQQVIASVLRNLSWRADVNSKKTLREVGSVKALMECALEVKKESTLKSVLSALWNLSAHCTENKADICAVDGALAFLVGTLTYRSQTNTLAIIESGGGILRNVSSLIATNEDHRQILRDNNCLQTLLQHLKSHSLTIVSNACGTLWNLSARNPKDQEALWDMGAVSMLKNLIHSKHKMIAMGSAAALRNLMANRPAKYKDANIMSPGSSLPSLHVRKQKALEAELDAQHLSETFDNIDNLSPKASHRSKQRHKQNLYGDYVFDASRHDDNRSDNFNAGNMTVLSPYLNTTVLPSSSSSRGSLDSSRSEKDRSLERERGLGLGSYHPATENPGTSSKRGLQISTTVAQIAKVMEEVSAIHTPQEDRSSESTTELHCVPDERNALRRSSAAHTHSNTYNFTKSENSNRTCPLPYAKLEYKRSSNDSLNSVSSSDGYGKRGQMKPSVESYSEDDESKFCSYGQYPADLAHKIHSANHMDDNDGELDTPINYSLKYSDEQLNSGRQSPSQNERWARPKHIIEDEIKQSEQRQSRSQSTTFPVYNESTDDKHLKFQPHFGQQECVSPYRSRGPNGSETNRVGSNHGINQNVNQSLCQEDDYEDDKPTNYSERYSEEEQHEEEERPTNYSIKYNEEKHHVDQPIDYSLKYATDIPPSQKPSFSFSKSSSGQSTKTDHISSGSENASTPSSNAKRQNHLHPSSAQTRSGQTQKAASCKVPSINQETIQTYCVEDTPICFSRCSSLSSLSSAEDEIGCDQTTQETDSANTLQIAELKENGGTRSNEETVSEVPAVSQHIRTKSNRLQASGLSSSESARHKAVEFSSGAKSPSKSGAQTPKSPPEHYVQETPLMFSRCTSVSSLDSFESRSIASSVQSEPCSGMISGIISPSDLPDSPGQTMPPSRSKTPPPPPQTVQTKREASKNKVSNAEKRESGPKQAAVNAAVQRVQVLPDADTLLHFATESTPDGFSCSSSLSALSLDEPFIQKDVELRIMPPVQENDNGNETESEQPEESNENQEKEAEKPVDSEKDILDDSDDDDIEILEECIISAMPTNSSRKNKKPAQTASKVPPPVARKPSQLPVYKLLPSQNRLQAQKHVMPRVYCVEGTPINFSTAASLNDLTIESPPDELAAGEGVRAGAQSGEFEKRDTIPTEGRSTDEAQRGKTSSITIPELDDSKTEEGDILAECINSAMPKGKSHKPFRVKKIMDQVQQASASSSGTNENQSDGKKKKPTSPVKPIPQNTEYRTRVRKNTDTKNNLNAERTFSDNKDSKKQNLKNNSKDFNDKLPNNEDRVRGSFTFDSPHHYTPIEGTPYCFSRNDSLSSLDFDDDDVDLSREKAELRKGKENKESEAKVTSHTELTSNQQSANKTQAVTKQPINRGQSKPVLQKQSTFPQSSKDLPDRGAATDEKLQNFAIENTPVCFSRNSSLSSLSDIDQENNNNKENEPIKETEPPDSQGEPSKPQASGYAPKSFHVEDTPVCFSRNSSLSSLSIDSEDDLLQECISSAMPKKKKPSRLKGDNEKHSPRNMGGILAEDLTLDLKDTQRPDSEHGLSPDSENFDWKAIQEGANSIVSSLHQAAAAACLSRQASSDSDSILSLKSGISLGSPFHLTPDQEEKPFTSNKGPRILKPGEKSTLETKKIESENKGIKGGKKVYKSLITGKVRSNSEVSSQMKQPLQTNMPSISRGRTMIHIPGVRNSSSSTSPVSKKGPPLKTPASKSPSESQTATTSPRGAKPSVKSELSPVTRQTSQPSGSNKGPSRSGSRDSTPSRPAQQPLSRPMQSPGRNSISPGRNGVSPPNKLSQLPRTSSPSTASTKSSGSGKMSYTSPGRQMSQQNLTKQTGFPKNGSSIPRSESASKGLNQMNNSNGANKKVELSRMSSTKSSGSESDRSERPVLVRQSTFIKEAPSPTLRRKLEESASFESLSPSSRPNSPTRSQAQTPVLSPSLPDMSLSTHSSVQPGGWRKLPPNLSLTVEYNDGRPAKRHDIARSHSESPSRLPINRSGTWKREHSKHSSSLPRVSTWRRTGSSSSILSASSESSEKAKSEDEKLVNSISATKQTKENQVPTKGTWRKIKESEISPTNSTSQTTSSGATNGAESKTLIYQMAPAVSKTEDVWVRIEDCPINNPRSGRSPTGNTPPVIDSVTEKGNSDVKDSKDYQGHQNVGNGSAAVRTVGLENRRNSFIQVDSPDQKGTEAKLGQSNAVPAPENSESSIAERTPFSSSSSSKHSSPSGTVAARVTPFNYNPSPRKSSADGTSARPSQIPTPVNNNTKKRDSKTDNTESSGTQSPKRHSGSYLVTSV
ncbi:adenomatous polyposis coli protein isoform X4 [Trichechus manatus latirostris]|uniref:Adenomatous polyposis coli protein isoform X4 n=1 Tax=Trichechus manatus latirostris TaxID=127582 RepID=A0A2Y9R825_TRIMA|nr:adenomatous polyposis coli protein isoform X4 [Trichechus manatus latirostris]